MYVYMDGMAREVYARVLGKGLVILRENGGRFDIYQLLFADDTALVADSEEKLNEFARVCENRKLRVNVCKSIIMRCQWYVNVCRMDASINGDVIEEVDCFKYLGSQVQMARG